MKTIRVTGDWVADWNLARPDDFPEGYFDGSLQTQLHYRPGGAWYIADLIKTVSCRDLTFSQNPSLLVEPCRDPKESTPGLNADGTQRDDLAHAYSVWWKHQRQNSGKKQDKVWRIGRFAGCRKSTAWTPPLAEKQISAESLLVVDDLGLGFADQATAVTHVSTHAGKDAKILLKHGIRPDGSGLLTQLLKEKLDDRLHVVVAANLLRRRNAAISRALSWDKALEDIEAEFKSGPSSRDLARCATAVIHFGLAGAAVFQSGKLHRFYFLPDELEHVWEDDRPGSSFGIGSVLTACMARYLIEPENYPLFFAITQALAAQRTAHHEGAGSTDSLDIDLPYGPRDKVANPQANAAAACIAPPVKPAQQVNGKDTIKQPISVTCVAPFRAAWNPADLEVWPEATANGLKRSRLLCNVTGTTPDSFHAKAMEVVIQGHKKALASVPKASYENYLTADRDEIESINEIRRLILDYKANPSDKRPLSIAVFGAPGSGKSFAIKQVASALFGKDKRPLEFNLTQLKEPEDLYRAFHQVRDASIELEIPLVFWDEFDAGGLKWLADFLAPMQDAEFFDGSHKHPFGKCIFVFAGATRVSFEEFKSWHPPTNIPWNPTPDQPWHQAFKDLKGPDFVSRLRGFVNVKGPNPTPPVNEPDADSAKCIANDPAYVLRRALVIRSEIERNFGHLIHPDTKRAAIAPNVLHALLSVERYEHGSRSISALLSMSALSGVKAFMVSALPSDGLMYLHVSNDFKKRLDDPIWSEALLLALAKAGHDGYRRERIKTESDADDAKPWEQLGEEGRQRNFDPVPRRLLELQRLGYFAVPVSHESACKALGEKELNALIECLAEPEHRIWLSDRLTQGFEKANSNQRWRNRNTDIIVFKNVARENQLINIAISTDTLKAFEAVGFCLIHNLQSAAGEKCPSTQ